MAVTVREAMKIGALAECKLLGGAGGLERTITYIGGMEIPSVKGWVASKQVVITTAYAIRNKPEALAEILYDLKNADASALCIKTRFIGEIPQTIIDLADFLNMPLIEVPDYITFVNINAPLMRTIINEQNVKFIESNFFVDLISDNVKSEEEALLRAANLGWTKLPLTLLVFDIDNFEEFVKNKNENSIFHLKESVLSLINMELRSVAVSSTIIRKSDSFSCLLPQSLTRATIRKLVQDIQEKTKAMFKINLTAGACVDIKKYTELKMADIGARDAIRICRYEQRKTKFLFIDEVKLERVFLSMKNNTYMLEYVQSTISKLREFDAENGTQLLLTLEQLIRCMGVRTKAAEQLFLHRNTLAQRLKKIESITGCNLAHDEDLLSLSIALKMHRFLD